MGWGVGLLLEPWAPPPPSGRGCWAVRQGMSLRAAAFRLTQITATTTRINSAPPMPAMMPTTVLLMGQPLPEPLPEFEGLMGRVASTRNGHASVALPTLPAASIERTCREYDPDTKFWKVTGEVAFCQVPNSTSEPFR
eukprot:CAMPEP_0119117312 /NCGR_PEP_ID=MMETSP1180-20130426/52767_1 /TAXON_ID=3052 ORGANISM="Chlamydomonas cf sp, Strain CCMP681" /NCGR_SAMPLE_ID=MMETSP1180 /ASSEMBLY_ACC=CAM_ASM_000741 /LENGTH=137 /DNA_ID=CAMNT_0007106551 /DNA_START=1592 /DNA_END=2005 /DNA_ORIENTATION=+